MNLNAHLSLLALAMGDNYTWSIHIELLAIHKGIDKIQTLCMYHHSDTVDCRQLHIQKAIIKRGISLTLQLHIPWLQLGPPQPASHVHSVGEVMHRPWTQGMVHCACSQVAPVHPLGHEHELSPIHTPPFRHSVAHAPVCVCMCNVDKFGVSQL